MLFSRLEIATWVVTIVLLVGMVLLLKRTALGIQLRASTEDFRMAQLVGVKANWVISSAFAITGFLAAAVTILYMLNHGDVRPNVGQGPLLIAFVGVVIGGLGSLGGAALGGFTLGVMINIFSATLPRSIQGHTLMFAFLLVILMLVFQPNGLMGTVEKLRRKRAARRVPPRSRRNRRRDEVLPARVEGDAPDDLDAAPPVGLMVLVWLVIT